MQRALITIAALFTGMFALLFSLILAIPLTLMAIFKGKQLQKKMASGHFEQSDRSDSDIIEGEFQRVPPKNTP
jgi:UPF0716 family protein affecting phage T7 exclusion